MILRSTGWDGPPPAPGDLIHLPDNHTWGTVRGVTAGAGIGHYTITVDAGTHVPASGGPNVYRWRGPTGGRR